MGKFRVKATSFFYNKLVEPGTIIEHDGPYHDNLEPVEAPPSAAAETAQQVEVNRKDLIRQKLAVRGVDLEHLADDEGELHKLALAHGIDPKELPPASVPATEPMV